MNWLETIKHKLSLRRLAQVERSTRTLRDFVDIDRAKTVGLIINVGDCSTEELRTFRHYIDELKHQNKHVTVLEINFTPKSEPQFRQSVESIFLNPAKLNWLDFPNNETESLLRNVTVDVLIDLDNSDRMTSRYICSVSGARTRVGRHREGLESCYELMIDESNPVGIPKKIETYTYFLSMIEK